MTISITLPAGLVGALFAAEGDAHVIQDIIVGALVDRCDLQARFCGEAGRAVAFLLAHPEVLDGFDQ